MEIYNTILVGTNKDPKFEILNGEIHPIILLQHFEYIIELKYGVNDNLKAK